MGYILIRTEPFITHKFLPLFFVSEHFNNIYLASFPANYRQLLLSNSLLLSLMFKITVSAKRLPFTIQEFTHYEIRRNIARSYSKSKFSQNTTNLLSINP